MVEPPRVGADEPVVRLATPDDVPGMVRVLERAFAGWPPIELEVPAVDHLRWKMSRPGPDQAHSVAVVDGEIAAVSVRWGSRMQVGAGELMQDGGVDQAVDPRMQGRGLGRAIATFSHEAGSRTGDVSLGTGSAHAAIAPIFDQFDPVLVSYPMTVWTRPFAWRTFLGTHWRGGGPAHLLRTGLRVLRRRFRSPAMAASGVAIEVIEAFDERADALWQVFAPQFDVATVRDASYLNWRYADVRAGRSLILGAFEGRRLVGYAVFKRAGATANVLELVADPERPGAYVDLLAAGEARMRAAGAGGMTCWLPPGHPAEAALAAAGYLDAGRTAEVGLGPLRRAGVSPGVDLLFSGRARWHWTMGDDDFL